MKICKNCHKDCDDNMSFCPYCGVELEDKTSSEEKSDSVPQNTAPSSMGWAVVTVLFTMFGGLMFVVGIFTSWIISFVGGVLLGVAYVIYKNLYKR